MPKSAPNYFKLLLESAVLKSISKQPKSTIKNGYKTSLPKEPITPDQPYHNKSSTLIITAIKQAVLSDMQARIIMDYLVTMIIIALVTAVVLSIVYIRYGKQKRLPTDENYNKEKEIKKEHQGKLTPLGFKRFF